MESSMDINLEVTPIDLKKIPRADDSLKLVGIQKKFNIITEIPSNDVMDTTGASHYDTQISETLNTLKALQTAKKSLSDVQSITKDIKSNYKTEKNDSWAPVDDTMLQQRYELVQQIKDILQNATFNHKNVFTIDYSKDDVKLDLEKKDIRTLNLRDEQSINIFSDNIDRLSRQIEDNIQKLQTKIDKANQSKWLSMENLRNVRLQQKEVNSQLKTQDMPSLASALAQIAQQQATSLEPEPKYSIEAIEKKDNLNNEINSDTNENNAESDSIKTKTNNIVIEQNSLKSNDGDLSADSTKHNTTSKNNDISENRDDADIDSTKEADKKDLISETKKQDQNVSSVDNTKEADNDNADTKENKADKKDLISETKKQDQNVG